MNLYDDKEVATIAGGCFWCVEATFNEVVGIEKAVSGYTGGKTTNPSYSEVCSGATGHTEAIQLTFDPKRISYEEILRIFFSIHDPTTLNRQGADVGTQYRSAIFYHTEEQKALAEQVIQELNNAKLWSGPIVTEVAPFHEFYVAEDYHQKYFKKNPEQSYCQIVIAPKLAKFRKQYLSREKIN
ncbi:peptide-methionine (S)-S-oxide reductase MsrA [Chloroflexota bacterium]